MKKKTKIILAVIVGIIVLYGVIFVTDMSRVKQLKKPIFCIENGNMGSMTRFDGLGYKIGLDINATTEEITYGQMTMLGQYVVKLYKEEEKESTYIPTEIENVSMSIFDISSTGATIIIKDTNVTPSLYGEWYKIEKEIDGKWYECNPIIKDYAFVSIGYAVDKNNEVKFEIDWEWLYGKLPSGNYRILKESHHKHIAVTFSISTNS